MKHKTLLVIVLAIVLFSVIIQHSFAFTPLYGKVIATRVNVRKNPNTRSEILGQVEKGDEVLVGEMRNTSSGQWYFVMVINGELEGWVLGKYIHYERPEDFRL